MPVKMSISRLYRILARRRYEYQTVVDNVSLLTPELLSAVGRLVVESLLIA